MPGVLVESPMMMEEKTTNTKHTKVGRDGHNLKHGLLDRVPHGGEQERDLHLRSSREVNVQCE